MIGVRKFVAVAWIAAVLAATPWAHAGELDRAQDLYDAGNFNTALEVLTDLVAQSPSAEAYFRLGQVHAELGDLPNAESAYEQAIALDDSKARYHIGLGAAIGRQINPRRVFKALRESRRTRRAFEKAVELEPDNVDARAALMQFYLRAPGIAGGDADKAREQAQRISQLDLLEGHFALASVHEHEGDRQAALREYESALSDFPDDPEVPFAYGLYLTSIGRYGEAIEIYRTVLDADPGNHQVRYQMGRTASISGQFLDTGREALTGYLEHKPRPGEPSHAWAHYRLGLIEAQTDNVEAARSHYTAAIALDANHDEARDALKDLGKRRPR